jgi:hypothetical protein
LPQAIASDHAVNQDEDPSDRGIKQSLNAAFCNESSSHASAKKNEKNEEKVDLMNKGTTSNCLCSHDSSLKSEVNFAMFDETISKTDGSAEIIHITPGENGISNETVAQAKRVKFEKSHDTIRYFNNVLEGQSSTRNKKPNWNVKGSENPFKTFSPSKLHCDTIRPYLEDDAIISHPERDGMKKKMSMLFKWTEEGNIRKNFEVASKLFEDSASKVKESFASWKDSSENSNIQDHMSCPLSPFCLNTGFQETNMDIVHEWRSVETASQDIQIGIFSCHDSVEVAFQVNETQGENITEEKSSNSRDPNDQEQQRLSPHYLTKSLIKSQSDGCITSELERSPFFSLFSETMSKSFSERFTLPDLRLSVPTEVTQQSSQDKCSQQAQDESRRSRIISVVKGARRWNNSHATPASAPAAITRHFVDDKGAKVTTGSWDSLHQPILDGDPSFSRTITPVKSNRSARGIERIQSNISTNQWKRGLSPRLPKTKALSMRRSPTSTLEF